MSPTWMRAHSDGALVTLATSLFTDHFRRQPAGVWAAPGRVNLIGDHVDYAGGISIPFALSHSTAVAVSPRTDGQISMVSAKPAAVGQNNPNGKQTGLLTAEVPLADVRPGFPSGWSGYVAGSLWAGLSNGVVSDSSGMDIAIVSDVPIGSGLSSSAALECSTILAAHDLAATDSLDSTPRADEIALMIEACIRAENEVVGAQTGGLDQRSSFLGKQGLALRIDFHDDAVSPISCATDEARLCFLVADTNSPHNLGDGQYASRRGVIDAITRFAGVSDFRSIEDPLQSARDWAQTDEATAIGVDKCVVDDYGSMTIAERRAAHVVEETNRTAAAAQALIDGDFTHFGTLMNESHRSLRDLYEVSTPELNCAQEAACAAGALGARMTGGGFGGSIIALIEARSAEDVAASIASAAAERGFAEPTFLAVSPAAGARRLA